MRMYNNNDIFCEYFLTHPDWYIYEAVLDYDDESPNKSEVLTWKKYMLFRKLWNDIKTDYKTIGLWKRILKYIYGSNKYPFYELEECCEYYIIVATDNVMDKIAKLKNPKEIYDEIESCFNFIENSTFIEYKTGYMVQDNTRLDRFQTRGMQKDRLIYKWKYGEPGYGSPTFPAESFTAWENHKKEFPEYCEKRAEYLEFQKKFTNK